MKKFLITATSITALFAFAGSASAADAFVAPDPAYDWTGFYLGAQFGYAWGDAEHDFDNGAPSDNSDPEGILGGVHVGYLHQFDSIVLGVEADIEATDIDGSFDNLTGISSSGSTDIDMQGSARLRLGFAADRLLPYITGGLAWADVDYGGGPAGGPCCGYSDTPLGYTIGAGIDYAATDAWSVRIEYRFTDFGRESDGLDPDFPAVNMPVDLETHSVMLGFSYHL